jgi:hypothetical protein
MPHNSCKVSNRGGVCAEQRMSVGADLIDTALRDAISAPSLPASRQYVTMPGLDGDTDAGPSSDAQRAGLDRKLARI